MTTVDISSSDVLSSKIQATSSVTEIREQLTTSEVTEINGITTSEIRSEIKPVVIFSGTKITKNFNCEYPSVDANVSRVREPLPFPEKLNDLIGWTDAFVDRIAILTVAQEKKTLTEKNEYLRKIERLQTLLDTTVVDLDKSRSATKAANGKADAANQALATAKAESAARAQTIKDLQAKAKKAEAHDKELHQRIADLTTDLGDVEKSRQWLLKELRNANSEAAEEHARWEAEHKLHLEDEGALARTQKALQHEIEAKNTALKNLDDVRAVLAKTQIELEVNKKTGIELNGKIVVLETKLTEATNSNTQLKQDVADLKKALEDAQRALDVAKKTITGLNADLASAKERILKIDLQFKASQETVVSLESKLKIAITENKTLTSEKTTLQSSLDEVKKTLSGVQTELLNIKTEYANKRTELENSLETIRLALIQAGTEKDAADAALTAEKATHKIELDGYKAAIRINPAKLKDLEALEQRLIPTIPGKRINILSVEYGGRAYTLAKNKDVLDKLYQAAEKGTQFAVENSFFGGDPKVGTHKSFSITYQLDGAGVPIHLFGWEHDKVSFRLSRD